MFKTVFYQENHQIYNFFILHEYLSILNNLEK